MSRYIEGYYCKDDNSIEGIKNESLRKVLSAISDSYPWGITADEISKRTDIPGDTVYGSLKTLENSGFIKREKNKPGRGRPKGSADTPDQSRAFKFHVENRNFGLNEGEAYQFAPGYTKYNPDFLYAWNVLVEKDQLDEIYPLFIKLLRRVMTKVTGSSDPILKEMIPMSETDRGGETISMLCRYCRTSHEARDFIRAILLHLLDEFETTRAFVDFFSEHKFISKDSYEYHHLLNQAPGKQKSKKTEQAKEWLDNLDQGAKETAELILKEKSSISLEQLKNRVDKLKDEQYLDEQLGEYTKMGEQDALSIIAAELPISPDYQSKLPEEEKVIVPIDADERALTHLAKKTATANQTLAKAGIKVTLYKVEFAADYTGAFLTVENNSTGGYDVDFSEYESRALQGEKQFKKTYRGPNYKQIRPTIFHGMKEDGVMKFESVYYTGNTIKFEFALKLALKHYLFVFEVKVPK